MAKKCIPGVICIENMTLFILFIIVGLVTYMIYSQNKYANNVSQPSSEKIVIIQKPTLASIPTRQNDSLNDPYSPPLKDERYFRTRNSYDNIGIPVNIETRGTGMEYQQVGILTPMNVLEKSLILPLMGRKLMNGRDKWQYYTIANGVGNINTKLPVSLNGRSCTGEYGCDDIQNGDVVYVEGYKTVFTVTMYENSTFSYIPYL
jgi:hypothetical protein